jgi:hypothetical protein
MTITWCQTFGISKITRLPEMCRGKTTAMWVPSSFNCWYVLEFPELARVTRKEEVDIFRFIFGLYGNFRTRRFQRYLQKGKRRSGRHSNSVSRQQMCPNGHNAVRKTYGILGGRGMGDGAGNRVMTCEMCTERHACLKERCANVAGKDSRS